MEKLIRSAKVFQTLTKEEQLYLQKIITERTFPKGTIILNQGHQGEGLFLLKTGKLAISANLPGDNYVKLANLSTGRFFGEVALLSNDPSTATVTAETDSTCLLLSKTTFDALTILNPMMSHKIISRLAIHISNRLRRIIEEVFTTLSNLERKKLYEGFSVSIPQASQGKTEAIDIDLKHEDVINLPAFAGLEEKETNVLLNYLTPLSATNHCILFRSGDGETSCYILINGSGQVVVECDGINTKLNVHGPGHILGLISFIDEKPHATTSIIREKAILLKVSKGSLNKLLNDHPEIYRKFYRNLTRLLVNLLRLANRQLIRLSSERRDESLNNPAQSKPLINEPKKG